MFMWWLFTMLFASIRAILSLASVSFRSCEDPFDYVRLSSSWTRSSSLRDFRQDDHTLEITSIFALLDARSFAMPMLRYLPLSYHASHIVNQVSNLPCPSKPLFGYVTALLSPSYSVVSCRWRLKFVPCWNMEIPFLVGTFIYLLGYHNISYLINASIYW